MLIYDLDSVLKQEALIMGQAIDLDARINPRRIKQNMRSILDAYAKDNPDFDLDLFESEVLVDYMLENPIPTTQGAFNMWLVDEALFYKKEVLSLLD